MDQLRAMKVFLRVAERGSLSAASADLGMARGAASAIVSDLEKYLGVQLLERTTRSLRLTEDGQHYVDRARGIVADIESLEDEVGGAKRRPRGRLRVQIPPGLSRLVVAPALPRFCDAYPEIELQVLSRNSLPDFVAEEIDAAVVIGPIPALDIVARPVGAIPYMTVAAPAYLQRCGVPAAPDDLGGHNCIPVLSTATGRPVPWRFRTAGRNSTVPVAGALAFESAEAAVAAAVRGAGILQLASYLVYQEVKAGKLVPVLESCRPQADQIYVVHKKHRLKPRKLRVFEEFLIDLNAQTRRKWQITAVD
ncbi:LysR family transcriptional regulator [Oricola nitratireducens]|uniref:LysR family transcriptional regulator n=1 Tax=Oricola nitratireducens TaxID=2775868 RepID=UPI0018672F88|nr:LysR family transcriptional regulator [Oricola nitratireducens]